VELNNLIVKKALQIAGQNEKSASADKLVKTAAAEQATFMVTNKLIDANQQKRAEDMLQTPAGALSVLKNALNELAETKQKLASVAAKANSLGAATPENFGKSGGVEEGYDSLNDGYVGRKTTEKKASDRVLFEKLGIQLPSSKS
jgi:hypothetical protein